MDQAEREQVLREARLHINRGRRALPCPSADADSWLSSCPSAPVAAAAPTVAEERGPAAVVVPDALQRWRADADLFERQQREAEAERRAAERRAIEQRHQQRAASASGEIETLRGEVVELGKAANTFATAIAERIEAQAAELAELKSKLAVAMARIDDLVAAKAEARGRPAEEIPRFLS
jgi:hypothetical protein